MASLSPFLDELRNNCNAILNHIQKSMTKLREFDAEVNNQIQSSDQPTAETIIDCDELDFFAPPDEISALLSETMAEITRIVQLLDSSTLRVETVFNYFLDFLYQYHFEHGRFTEPLSVLTLGLFEKNLTLFIQSIQAYEGAQNGDINIIKAFLTEDPSAINRPLLNGYTLLYVAVMNGKFDMVKYLIKEAKCSVNALNQNDPSTDIDTPLHIACSNKDTKMVTYLLEQNANCYIENKSKETATMIANADRELRAIFSKYLILDYTGRKEEKPELPKMKIMNQLVSLGFDVSSLQYDCVWEYLPLNGQNWQSFTPNQTNVLNATLRSKDDTSVDLKLSNGVGTISLIRFLQESGSNERNDDKVWVRCRGSSLLNFDVICIWQILYTVHPTGSQSCSNKQHLKNKRIQLPVGNYNVAIELHSWYFLDERMSKFINEAMNERLRYVRINTGYWGWFNFNLESFTFVNDDKSIQGLLRWLPKFVHIDAETKRITPVFSFHKIGIENARPVPLRNKLLHDWSIYENQELELYTMDDDLSCHESNAGSTDESTDADKTCLEMDPIPICTGPFNDPLIKKDEELDLIKAETHVFKTYKDSQTKVMELSQAVNKQKNVVQYLEKQVNQAQDAVNEIIKKRKDIEPKHTLLQQLCKDTTELYGIEEVSSAEAELADKENMLEDLRKQRDNEQQRYRELEDELKNEKSKVQHFENFQREQEQAVNDLISIKYKFPGTEIIHLQASMVEAHLRELNYPGKRSMHEKNIKIKVDIHSNEQYLHIWTVQAYSPHHTEMNALLNRVDRLIRQVEEQKDLYIKRLDSSLKTFIKEINGIPLNCKRKIWLVFLEIFQNQINIQRENLCRQFETEVGNQGKLLVCNMIQNTPEWAKTLSQKTENFLKHQNFMNNIESLKNNSFEQFLMKMKEPFDSNSEYSKKACNERDSLLCQLQDLLKSGKDYSGHEPRHFSLLSSLIHRAHLVVQCFKLKLPLFESSVEIMKKINDNEVVVVSTATGSGKSTLLPPLLVAAGYEKIFVTQPRRLPCTLLSKRVNTSMEAPSLSDWVVSGARSHRLLRAPIVYLTDGLLKEYLTYREKSLIYQAKHTMREIVIFIDEVHERSINIDLCLALSARFLDRNRTGHSIVKFIISSATFDPDICHIFRPFRFHQMVVSTPTMFNVEKKCPSNENIIDLLSQLNQKLERKEQILCFVKSAHEVTEMINLLQQTKNLGAAPLIQSQPATEQQKLIETKHIFFSTTVAETSLTFPALKYVIDTGCIHMPVYDPSTDTTELRELNAAESTVKQRQGRLGRTCHGEYYPLYTFDPSEKKFPVPQICQTELSHIEFSLRRSPLNCGIADLKKWMPKAPDDKAIDAANKRLRALDILNTDNQFTSLGQSLSRLPDFGSLSLSKAVFAALNKYNCGRDLLRLAAILSVVNTSSILRSIPVQYTKAEGDYMTLLAVMDAILEQKLIQPPHLFSVPDACKSTGLTSISYILRRALLRYESYEKFFATSKKYRKAAQTSSNGEWTPIARALLEGFPENVFISLAELQGKKHRYLRYTVSGNTNNQRQAVLDSKSKLARPLSAQPVSWVLARDILVSTEIRDRSIVSFLGEIEPDWLEHALTRIILLTDNEVMKYNQDIRSQSDFVNMVSNVSCSLIGNEIRIEGRAGFVSHVELYIRKKLVVTDTIRLIAEDEKDQSLKNNAKSLTETLRIFCPMVWRWKGDKQVKIVFLQKENQIEIVIKAREANFIEVLYELNSFVGWLRPCTALHLDGEVIPRRFIDPKTRQVSTDIENRIKLITDTKLTSVDIWPRLIGPKATRETRMEVVAWIAVCIFNCKLEGGFVRDWIVAHQSARPNPSVRPEEWVQFSKNNIPIVNKDFVPTDLDCHLPIDQPFDIDRFLDEVHKYRIPTEVYRQHWRYVLLFDHDSSTGPFSMDLIEPHVAITHNRIDFDVNNLYLMRNFCSELGQRVDLRDPPFSTDLEQIVEKIRKKQFRVLRPEDDIVKGRVKKMIDRGWQKEGEDLNYIPPPAKNLKFVLDPLPHMSQIYQNIEKEMKQIPNCKIVSIEQIRNPTVFQAYHGKKLLIMSERCDEDPNERRLFHGTRTDVAENIMSMGFDERHIKSEGLYGHGVYFADKPIKSHQYTKPSKTDINRKMLYCLVTLGSMFDQNKIDQSIQAPPVNYHSVRGLAKPEAVEYIIYNSLQAMPLYLITYQA